MFYTLGMIGSYFSLRKSKRTFRQIYKYYFRKKNQLPPSTQEAIVGYLKSLQEALLKKDSTKAKQMVIELEEAIGRLAPKNIFDRMRDFASGILFALFIAVIIRTMWFELYTIPTGSMRPTLKEEDYLIVSKTDYGLNVPLQEAHFYFDENLVRRGSIIVFNGANMEINDSDTVYFYLFPGKKQFVKRLIGKPGDTLYFYGGQIYGIDKEGRPLTDLEEINRIEHIPFIRFEGKVDTPEGSKGGIFTPALFSQMNTPIAKLTLSPLGRVKGEMILHPGADYSDFLGMKHFAMARLLTKEDLKKLHPKTNVAEGLLYLELTHHPTLQGAELSRDEYNRLRPDLHLSTSIIALQKQHLEALSQNMTTCRFSVKDTVACRLGWNPKNFASYLPKFPGVPDGTYEIQNGKVYQLPFPNIPIVGIFTNGITRELPLDHPLYAQDPETIYKLYNLGIEFINQYLPSSKQNRAFPSRYAYFRNDELYLLGAPIFKKEDPILQNFYLNELQKRSSSYTPFIDRGPPSLEEIQKYGIKVPDKMYLALGDNHAMSADSRQFGFVPEENLKGGVSFLFSPPGPRWGKPPQPTKQQATLPNLVVWGGFLLIVTFSSFYFRRKEKRLPF